MSDKFDLSLTLIDIPQEFWDVPYVYSSQPGVVGLENGANCQHYAYSFLRHHGFFVPDLFSSDLWEDEVHTQRVERGELRPLDLVILHKKQDAYGAHVGVYIGKNLILHLSRDNGKPAIEDLDDLTATPQYRYFIGAKRCSTGK